MVSKDVGNVNKILEKEERKNLLENSIKRPEDMANVDLFNYKDFAVQSHGKFNLKEETRHKNKLDMLLESSNEPGKES